MYHKVGYMGSKEYENTFKSMLVEAAIKVEGMAMSHAAW
jgi:hypothetical protein